MKELEITMKNTINNATKNLGRNEGRRIMMKIDENRRIMRDSERSSLQRYESIENKKSITFSL